MTSTKRIVLLAAASAVLLALVVALLIEHEDGMTGLRARLRELRTATVAAVMPVAVTAAPVALPAAVPGPVPPTTFGIHVSSPGDNETFNNLAIGAAWSIQAKAYAPWTPMPAEYQDESGNLKTIPAGMTAGFYLATPDRGKNGITVRCTFTGKATVWIEGPSIEGSVPQRSNDFKFRWTLREPKTVAQLNVKDMDPAHPLRDLDCRNSAIPRDQRFSANVLDIIKGFKVIRFMDWQNTNDNNPVTWATRHLPGSGHVMQGDGVSIEDMLALAKLNDSDPWFNMPWRADDDYVRHFAQMVHDQLPAGHIVYVELANEVWNDGFPQGRAATKEGLDKHYSTDGQIANVAAYSEHLMHVMDIWRDVFADDPKRLVRVASGQAPNIYRTGLILNYKDLPRHVDAFAIAPYFSYDATGMPEDVDEIYRRIPAGIEEQIKVSVQNKAMAHRVGLRLIAYESSQGLAMGNVELLQKVERDPRMGEMTKRYMDAWRERVGDTMIVFGTAFPISVYGAWGLVEYLGQPASEAPKLRAVREELAR
ncbi:hypothetical protein [Sphingomonas nostoxanthinifaciens]|uniref:hypothetical protein n=1 Tax=Sphingomonas nostoxanthinifaciens TaxID=2872652 RepID=UPI001CC1D359|nr:hypothetical protein [Sphingomonas nostoxanthinifaciens]UAK23063.1 hypothetical protein K8P63_11555 [Sphingomonas nostoxanthinifaciens]